MLAKLKSLFKKTTADFSPAKLQADKPLKIIIGLLLVFGLIMLASASSVVAYSNYQDSYFFFKKQFFSVIFGLIAFWFLSKFNYHYLRKFAFLALVVSIILLLLVFVPGLGVERNGSRSWLEIFGLSIQPAEFVKLTFIIYLAALFEKGQETAKRFWSFGIIYIVLAVLMLMQPDLGTLSIITLASFVIYYVGGGKLKHIFWCLIIGFLALFIIIKLPTQSNRLDRFRCWSNASRDTQKACYQINQSLIAIGSGGILGRGLGESRQKFLYIPEVQNDFIFSIVAEETGLIGTSIVIILFILLFYRCWVIARRLNDPFGRNLVIGIIAWVSGQAILNIGGITNFLPMTGVPLPFISYGGTAVMAVLAGLGVVANVSKYAK